MLLRWRRSDVAENLSHHSLRSALRTRSGEAIMLLSRGQLACCSVFEDDNVSLMQTESTNARADSKRKKTAIL